VNTPYRVEFDDSALASVKQLANDQGISATLAVHQAIAAIRDAREKQKAGTRFFAIDPDGSQYEVSF
jgi:hypothetical protein